MQVTNNFLIFFFPVLSKEYEDGIKFLRYFFFSFYKLGICYPLIFLKKSLYFFCNEDFYFQSELMKDFLAETLEERKKKGKSKS